jgi:F0F1-type ATP synthase assembly protein I
LAKFKKKKSEPTPDPEDSKKESIKEENNEIPETESSSESEPIVSQTGKSEKDKKLDKLFYLRVGFAVIAGTLATFLFEDIQGEERRWASIVFMIIIFIVTIFIAKSMNMQLPSSDRKKIVTQGIGSYIFLYLFVWILTYTIVHAGTISTGIPSPLS